MRPDRRVRNVVVVIGYLLAIPVVLASLPLLVAGAVARNYRNAAGRLARLPGVSPDGGAKSATVVAVYGFVLWGLVLLAAGPTGVVPGMGGDQPVNGAEVEDDGSQAADDLSGADAADATAEAAEESPDQDILVLFETLVDRSAIDLADVDRDGDVLRVEYYQRGTSDEERRAEMGHVAGAYIGAVGEGLTTERMELVTLDPDDDAPIQRMTVESEWAEAYNDGEMSMDEVARRSLETLEPVEE